MWGPALLERFPWHQPFSENQRLCPTKEHRGKPRKMWGTGKRDPQKRGRDSWKVEKESPGSQPGVGQREQSGPSKTRLLSFKISIVYPPLYKISADYGKYNVRKRTVWPSSHLHLIIC